MADDERMHRITQVAQMYYEQSVTQESIAAALSISRPTVSRLLREAREEGVVQITVNSPFRYVPELETEIQNAFPHLRHVRILRTVDSLAVARFAASYVSSVAKEGDIIGVSWGNTMAEMAEFMPNRKVNRATVVQLNGGVARAGEGTNAHDIVSRFGRAFEADCYYLQVPAIVDNLTVCDALLQNRETARVLDLGRQTSVAVYGIGMPESQSVLVQAGYFTPQYLHGLRRKGAIGDICSRYFTAHGAVCEQELDGRTIGIPLQDLARRDYAIAVVHGVAKAGATLGALRGRLMNVLIADEATAHEVMRLHQGGQTTHD